MTSDKIHQIQRANIYDPLPDGAYTRVLILEPGRRRQPLRCRLKVVNLEDRPDFEAISYVWGRGIKRKKVLCNGHRIKITPNLLQALMAVRYPSKQRIVWADSISINQYDDKEKGSQVALMGPIFNRATRVLIHLAGDDRGHAHRVATYLSEILTLIHQNQTDGLVAVPNSWIQGVEKLAAGDVRLQSYKYLLDHPWFQRGWVIQEALLARDAVVIWGSRRTTALKSLMIFHQWIFGNLLSYQACVKCKVNSVDTLSKLYAYRFREAVQVFGHASRTQPSLSSILYMARPLKFKDPRDRVYAFLYLENLENHLDIAIDAASRLSIQPDYSKSVAEVYADFARYITKSGDIRWLTFVQHTQESLAESGYASWIPRWDTFDRYYPWYYWQLQYMDHYPIMHHSHRKSDNGRQEIPRFDGNCLTVSGVIFDRVRACQRYSSTGEREPFVTLSDAARFWRMATTSNLGYAYSPEHLYLALFNTLTQACTHRPLSQWIEEQEVLWDFLQAAEESSATIGSFKPHIPLIEKRVSITTVGRHLITTERGYFGLAPRITAENDVCCIIFGCHFPFILREVPNPKVARSQCYRVVGDAWVAGKQPLMGTVGVLYMPLFGAEDSMEWETWGLEGGEITLI